MLPSRIYRSHRNTKRIVKSFLSWLICLSAISISSVVHASDEWRPVISRDLQLKSGSILDFSEITKARSGSQARFFCASQPFGIERGFPDHTTADNYARQLRLHGYNLARFHFVENVLMTGRRGDLNFDPIQMDRFHYFLAALKREGIAWLLDGMTSWNGAFGDVGLDRWAKIRNVKAGLYYDPDQKMHWKEMIRRILGAYNPYTARKIIADDNLYGIILVNEGGLNPVVNSDSDSGLDRLFERWLINRYGSTEAATKRWGTKGPRAGNITLPRRVWNVNPWVVDAQRFYYEAQTESLRWMSEYLRDLGYQGKLSAYDNWTSLQDQATRAHLSWIDMHDYHELPSRFAQPGSRIQQTSSLERALEYVRNLASARYWGKPFTVSEHGHPFWNQWRYESGLAIGAYAALQGWNLICRHGSGPIELAYGAGTNSRSKAIYPFGIGMDPIERANETLSALLYLRGDVKEANHRIGVQLSEPYAFEQKGGIGQLPTAVTQLGLVSGIGLLWGDEKPRVHLDAIIKQGEMSPNGEGSPAAIAALTHERSFGELLIGLQRRGVLLGNISDGSNIFISDTGEVILEPLKRTLRVITSKTEAVAFDRAPGRLDALTVIDSSGPGLVAASSIDQEPLEKSTRILLILATDARNSNMRFADAGERELLDLGSLPVLMRTVRTSLRLRHARPADLNLYALQLNGERAERVPLEIEADAVRFKLDTAALNSGPTTFFELLVQ